MFEEQFLGKQVNRIEDEAGLFGRPQFNVHTDVPTVFLGVVSPRISQNGWKFRATAALRDTKSRSRITSCVELKGGVGAYNRVRVSRQTTRCRLGFPASHLRRGHVGVM